MPLVNKKISDAVLLIVGSGIKEQNLKALTKKMSVDDDTVIFTGRVPHEDVQNYYSIMDILYIPESANALPNLSLP